MLRDDPQVQRGYVVKRPDCLSVVPHRPLAIYATCNWTSDRGLKDRLTYTYPLNGHRLVEPGEKYDVALVFNKSKSAFLDYRRAYIIRCEPTLPKMEGVATHPHALVPFELGLPRHVLSDAASFPKWEEISGIWSAGRYWLPEMRIREEFANHLSAEVPQYHHIGRGDWSKLSTFKCALDCPYPWGQDDKDRWGNGWKWPAVLPYKYHVAIENSLVEGYFTEKLLDGIVAGCLVFYHGHESVVRWIDPDAFVRIDVSKPKEAAQVIRVALEEDWYQERKSIVHAAAQRLLVEMNPFNWPLDALIQGKVS